ncbi:esterase-like activity of phytase family protein [Geminicoccus flavidas]|uniref:esterase-like activity of phytase family protein n=1 Tax=Geminicoccus flavidas TaxID=2506407 RepID=UPI00135CF214|nr:esterase-like activity of phytase family protein [Geminicoccus flavidas]
MRKALSCLLAGVGLMALAPSPAEAQSVPAELAGHAILPAMTMVPPPADAPALFQTSGKFAGPGNLRVDEPGSLDGTTNAGGQIRPTGLAFPLVGQPVQGFSGIRSLGGDRFLVLTDNGFGAKANSADALLMFHELQADWASGRVRRVRTTFLHDPDRVVPFRIATETTAERYLTGADFDPESIQSVGDRYWIGEEFGPYLLEVDRTGRVLRVVETLVDGRTVRSADHPSVLMPPAPGPVAFEVRRSKGFEGMAQSPDGAFLYPLLEGPLLDKEGRPETVDGKEALRILEFDTAQGVWSGRSWFYPLEEDGHAIGDFNMIDATRGLVIERDNLEGSPADACQGEVTERCIASPAAFKRVYLIEFGEPGRPVRKIAHLDLMDIADPKGLARQGGGDGKFDFPFFTIENVDVAGSGRIVVGNDNNLPFSAGRFVDRADANELILLEVGDFLDRK